MAAIEMQHQAFNPTLTTTQAIMPEKPRVPIVAHIITDDDIGVLKVTFSFIPYSRFDHSLIKDVLIKTRNI